jgi:hypothetical protein
MNKFWILVTIALAGVLHIVLVDNAYWEGYEDAEKLLGTTPEQCYRWWFGDDGSRFEHEMKQFCKRN